jgi:hypothetical protein
MASQTKSGKGGKTIVSVRQGAELNHNETLLGVRRERGKRIASVRQGTEVNHNETLLGVRGINVNHKETLAAVRRVA